MKQYDDEDAYEIDDFVDISPEMKEKIKQFRNKPPNFTVKESEEIWEKFYKNGFE